MATELPPNEMIDHAKIDAAHESAPVIASARKGIFDALGDLPLRAMVVVAYRCAKRIEPLRRHWELLPEVYVVGLPLFPYPEFGSRACGASVNAAFAAVLAHEGAV